MVLPSFRSHILIVDDDARLCSLLKTYLQREHFLVSCAVCLKEARNVIRIFKIDLVILDVMLPHEEGWGFFSEPSEALPPVIFLSARGGPRDRTQGLSLGAKDYMLKPFEPEELLLRITRLIPQQVRKEVLLGGCIYHLDQEKLTRRDGEVMNLTPLEQKILGYMVGRLGQLVLREEILRLFFPDSKTGRVVDVNISRLRKKIEYAPEYAPVLVSMRHQGYILKPSLSERL